MCEEYGHSQDHADHIFSETLKFLVASGAFDEGGLVPSASIDQGWHCFLLFTREYAKFCKDNIGTYIHHNPADGELESSSDSTYVLLMDRGVQLDPCLWGQANSGCNTHCDSGRGTEEELQFAIA